MLFNIKNIHVELSSKCVLKCPRCPRTELDLDNLNLEISLDRFKSMFPPTSLKLIETLIFCGDIGDPIYATEFLDIVRYIKHNSDTCLRIVTNGSYKKEPWWAELGTLLTKADRVTFSVDGWDNESNNRYRANSDFDSIVNGIKTLRTHSDCVIVWSMIYFSFNQSQVDRVSTLAQGLGCDVFKTVKSSKFDGKYLVNYSIDPLKPGDQLIARGLVYENHYEFFGDRTNLEAFEHRSTDQHPWAKCLNHLKEVFVNVQGQVYPCPWFGEQYIKNSFLSTHQERLSLRDKSIEEVLDDRSVWQPLVSSFDSEVLPICQIKCKHAQ